MKKEVRTAFVAASAANAATEAAAEARNLLSLDPTRWAFADQAYWLCRQAQKDCESAMDALDPEEAETNGLVLEAHSTAACASMNACEAADELVSLAEAVGHEIRR